MITDFTPFTSLLGGALIGLAAVMLMGSLGRIAGVSGILTGLFAIDFKEVSWKLAFIIGLVLSPYLFVKLTGILPEFAVTPDVRLLVAGGLLVGFGTSIGSGCTSGHGVCGMARLSKRSIWATGIFMSAAIVTVFIMRHVV